MTREVTITITASANASGDLEEAILSALSMVGNAISNGMASAKDFMQQGNPDEDPEWVEAQYEYETIDII